MGVLKFYKEVLREAMVITLSFLGFTSRVTTLRTVLIWVVTTLLIYQLSNHNIMQARLEVGASSLIGIVIVAAGTFLVCLFLAPAHLWSASESERNNLENIIQEASNIEGKLQELSSLYYKGRELYDKGFHNLNQKSTWENSLRNWKEDVEQKLQGGFSVAELHKFRQLHDYSMFKIDSMEDQEISTEDRWLLSKYTAHLNNLDEIIQFSSVDFEASVKHVFESCRKT